MGESRSRAPSTASSSVRYASTVETARRVCPTRSRTVHSPSAGRSCSSGCSHARSTTSVKHAAAARNASRRRRQLTCCTTPPYAPTYRSVHRGRRTPGLPDSALRALVPGRPGPAVGGPTSLAGMPGEQTATAGPGASPGRSNSREPLLAAAFELFARAGVRDLSLRQIAAAIGTSHRMLIYHFGSREGLLVAVVEELERRNAELLETVTAPDDVPLREVAWQFWSHVADTAHVYGPLFFELASHAMLQRADTEALSGSNLDVWLD